ncbi:MAG: hypothetical protein ACXAEU_09045 [Candidatus Hodarchaeales archaeon]|jgi:hypothetical protein
MDKNQLEKYSKYSPVLAVAVSSVLVFIVTMTSFWQLTLVATLIGGLLCTEMKWGAVAGAGGVCLAWLLYLLMNPVFVLADQIGGLIMGSSGAGWLIILLIFFVGALFGLLGGSIGSGLRMLIPLSRLFARNDIPKDA